MVMAGWEMLLSEHHFFWIKDFGRDAWNTIWSWATLSPACNADPVQVLSQLLLLGSWCWAQATSSGNHSTEMPTQFAIQRVAGLWNRLPRGMVTAPNCQSSRSICTTVSKIWFNFWVVGVGLNDHCTSLTNSMILRYSYHVSWVFSFKLALSCVPLLLIANLRMTLSFLTQFFNLL